MRRIISLVALLSSLTLTVAGPVAAVTPTNTRILSVTSLATNIEVLSVFYDYSGTDSATVTLLVHCYLRSFQFDGPDGPTYYLSSALSWGNKGTATQRGRTIANNGLSWYHTGSCAAAEAVGTSGSDVELTYNFSPLQPGLATFTLHVGTSIFDHRDDTVVVRAVLPPRG
jgi:hypothetical protein